MAEPLLDLSDVGRIRECIRRGSGPHGVIGHSGNIESCHQGAFLDDVPVERGLREGSRVVLIPVVTEGPEDGAASFFAVTGLLQVFFDEAQRGGMDGDIADFEDS